MKLQMGKFGPMTISRILRFVEPKPRLLMMRLNGKHGTDHVFCLDFHRRLIFDNEEKRPLRLSEEIVRICANESDLINMGELREMMDLSKCIEKALEEYKWKRKVKKG